MEQAQIQSYASVIAHFWVRGMNVGQQAIGQKEDDAWLARFHAGDREVIAEVYTEHFSAVHAAARRYLSDVDAEACSHDVFLRMVQKPTFRENYKGGSIRAWLCTVARNRAIDILRKHGREDLAEPEDLERAAGSVEGDRFVQETEARRLIQTFRSEVLPEKWRAVFDERFMKQRSQREAARELGMSRTTLAYQEFRIRSLLESHLLGGEDKERA